MISNQRFEAVTFDYSNLEEWKSYFKEIKDVAKSCKVIEEFWGELKRKCDGLQFKDLKEEFDYSTVLLGGVSSNGEYKERSLAKIYATLFGFKPENIHDLIEKLRRNLPPTTKIVVEETEFIRFVRNVLNKVSSILSQAVSKGLIDSDVDVEVDYKDILSDYKKLIEILENFVNNLAKILPNYNQKSLFVWTLDKLTYKYMTTAYPELRDERVFNVVKDVLGLEVIFSPDVEDERTKREYEVYSYHDGSIGKELVEIFKMIWDAFNGEYQPIRKALSLVFPEITNFKKEFYKAVASALINIRWNFPKNVEVAGKDPYYPDIKGDTLKAEYKISGIMLVSCSISYCSTKGNYWDRETECNISLLRLLDDLSPGLFLLNGLLFNLNITQNSLEIRTPNTRAIASWRNYIKWGIDNWDPVRVVL